MEDTLLEVEALEAVNEDSLVVESLQPLQLRLLVIPSTAENFSMQVEKPPPFKFSAQLSIHKIPL